MMPDHMLSSQVIAGNYLYPDNLPPSRIVDYEYGGIALNDASQGLMVQVWTLRLDIDPLTDIGTVWLGAPLVPETIQFAAFGITEVSLAFDQNMHPFVAFVESGQARYWWFDALDSTQKFTDLPVGTGPPKACLDDKRFLQTGASDILLSYIRAGTLYFREQRDRYLIEYTLATGVVGQVLQLGMTDKLRVQILTGTFE